MEFKDYYDILGVARNARDEDIKKAFRTLARRYHPDVARDKKGAEEKFKEINEAYEVLGNPESRRKYDELGAHWRQQGPFRPPPGAHGRRRGAPGRGGAEETFQFHFGGTGFSEFFEQFFGRGARAGGFGGPGFRGFGEDESGRETAEFAERGADIEGSILVTLDEALRGAVRPVTVRRTESRTGESSHQTFRVRIPAGVREGQLIRLAGKGEEGFGGGDAGDLYLRVRLAAHPDFQPRGADLYHDLDLAPWEAVLGCTVEVPTLEGAVSLRVPPGTGHGQQLRVRGRGLPAGDGARGDLYAVVTVRVPSQTTAAERTLWEELARTSHFKPRQGD